MRVAGGGGENVGWVVVEVRPMCRVFWGTYLVKENAEGKDASMPRMGGKR